MHQKLYLLIYIQIVKKIATDCLTELEPFIETVKPESKEANLMTVVENDIVQMNDFIQKMLEKD